MILRYSRGGSPQSEWVQLSRCFRYRHRKQLASMRPASNRDRRARFDSNGKPCLPPAAQKTDPLSIQVTAASDVNQINVCGPCLHTLISLTWCSSVRVEQTLDTHSWIRLSSAQHTALPVLTSIVSHRQFRVQTHCWHRQSLS